MHRKRLLQTLGFALALMSMSAASAQQTTEQYIPSGKSPGASGTYSYIGKIVAVDADYRSITVEDETGRHELKLSDATHIWLDRTKRKRKNTPGTFEDCEVGRSVEVMHLRDDSRTAAWIKIESR